MALAVVYCRCSTEEESQIDALKNQVIEARACVQENGWILVDEYVESKSGTTSRGRQQYSRLFDDMLTAKFDIIVIKSQDRLMRNTKDWYLFVDRLSAQGKKLYLYLERKFYSPDDALITGIKAILAEEYSRELSKKIVNAHKHRQMSGGRVMLTNRAYGFVKKADGSVAIDEEEARVIRRIYKLCAAGYGSRTIARLLGEEGIVSSGGKTMNASTIHRMIRNPLYKGVFVMNRAHFDFDTKKVMKNPENEWIYDSSLVPSIVEEKLWEQANRAMSLRAEKGGRNGRYARGSRLRENDTGESDTGERNLSGRNMSGKNPRGRNPGKYSLSGKLICGICGRPYYRTRRRKKTQPEKIFYEWKCSGYINYGRSSEEQGDNLRGCDNSHLSEELVFELLKQYSSEYFQMKKEEKEGIIESTIRLLEQALACEPQEQRLLKLEKEISGLEKKKKLLMDKLLDGVVSDDDYTKRNKGLDEKLEAALSKKRQYQTQAEGQSSLKRRLDEIKMKLEQGGLEKATVESLLDDIDKIVVHEWQLELQFHSLNSSLFLDYPFSSDTEKGRFLDRLNLMQCIKECPSLTVKQYAEKMGKSPYMIRNRINELRNDGYIEFKKAGKDRHWVIIKELSDIRKRQ